MAHAGAMRFPVFFETLRCFLLGYQTVWQRQDSFINLVTEFSRDGKQVCCSLGRLGPWTRLKLGLALLIAALFWLSATAVLIVLSHQRIVSYPCCTKVSVKSLLIFVSGAVRWELSGGFWMIVAGVLKDDNMK